MDENFVAPAVAMDGFAISVLAVTPIEKTLLKPKKLKNSD
jgi:hypothetical protein